MEIDNLVIQIGFKGAEEFIKSAQKSKKIVNDLSDSLKSYNKNNKLNEKLRNDSKDLDNASKNAKKFAKDLYNMGRTGVNATQSLSKNLLALGGVTIGVTGLVSLFNHLGDSYIKIGTSSKYLGVSAREIDGLTRAAKALGGSGDEIVSTIAKIRHLSDTLKMPGLSPTGVDKDYLVSLQKLSGQSGVIIDYKSNDVLKTYNQIIHAISRLHSASAQRMSAESLGISPEILAAIQSGQINGVMNQFVSGSAQNKSTYALALKFNKQKQAFFEHVSNLGMDAFIKAEPSLEKAVKYLTDFIDKIEKNPDSMKEFLSTIKKIADSVMDVSSFISILAHPVDWLMSPMQTDYDPSSTWLGKTIKENEKDPSKYSLSTYAKQFTDIPTNSILQNLNTNSVTHNSNSTNINKLEVHTNSNNVDGIVNDARKKSMTLTTPTIGNQG